MKEPVSFSTLRFKHPHYHYYCMYLQNSTKTFLSLFLATSSKFFPTRTLTGLESQSSGTSSVIRWAWNKNINVKPLVWANSTHIQSIIVFLIFPELGFDISRKVIKFAWMKIVNKQRLFDTHRIKYQTFFYQNFKFQSAIVTLKIKSSSPNSNKTRFPKLLSKIYRKNKSVTDIKKLQRGITITVLIPWPFFFCSSSISWIWTFMQNVLRFLIILIKICRKKECTQGSRFEYL